MWPLLACSILALAIVIEKFWNVRRRAVLRKDSLEAVRALVEEGRIEKAIAFCRSHPLPLTNVFREALEHFSFGWQEMEKAVEHRGRQEAGGLDRYLNLLGVVSSVAPMLGLLGTVWGLVKVFQELGTAGAERAAALSVGIAQALVATGTGLTIGIPSLVLYFYFHGRIERLVLEMEQHTFELFRILRERAAAGSPAARGAAEQAAATTREG
jgi:biopolymer transport protein ExbB